MAETTRRERLLWTAAVFTFVGTDAIGFQLRGALLPSIERTFAVSTASLGFVATAGTIGFVAAVLAFGLAAGRIDIRRAVLASAVAVAAGALATGLAPTFGVLLAALFVRGVATGPFRALDRAILSHLFPEGRARIFNLYAFVWAVGATAGPVVVVAALSLGSWRYAYVLVGAGFVLSAALVARLDLPASVGAEKAVSVADLRRVAHNPAVAGMAVALVFNGGVEGALFTWIPYFAAQQFPEATANLLLSTFLAAYLPGRLVYSLLTDRMEQTLTLLLVTIGVSIPLLVATVFLVEGLALFAVVFALGFFVSATFPTISAFGVSAVPEYSAPVNAIATSAGYVGIALTPPLVGLLTPRVGLTNAMGILPIFLGVVFLVVLATRWLTDGAVAGPEKS